VTLEQPPRQNIVIAGVTGDLARRKLLPALFSLFTKGLLPDLCEIIGFARSELDDERFRDLTRDAIEAYSGQSLEAGAWQAFARRLCYVQMTPEGYEKLKGRCGGARRLFYLAVPPDSVIQIVHDLAAHGLNEQGRLVIEKPFGRDVKSSIELDLALHEAFDESEVYRIDHFLGKETVQNLLVFRFLNSVFERVWNRDAVEHIQVTVAESIGIESRGNFYEEVGALRDMVQSHVLQMLALLTMDPPSSFEAAAIRSQKAKLLREMRPLDPRRVVRGQYTAGIVEGEKVPGYREEPDVAPGSETETYVALELFVDNWRWAGVPMYVRTGKHLPSRVSEIEVAFKQAPIEYVPGVDLIHPNHLVYRIQPDEAIKFTLLAKVPGPRLDVKQVDMAFKYEHGFMVEPDEAYERLLHDAMNGDQTLFVRQDAVQRAWEIVQPVLDNPPPLYFYDAGSWGPAEAGALVAPANWHLH
jgi:glucose-6-phosphate 1-dehydrogenase